MISKPANTIVEAEIVDAFVAIYQNNCTSMGCYYAEDDWKETFYDASVASLREKCSRFDARHSGIWKVFPTKLILFKLDGKEHSIEIYCLRADTPSELPDGTPLIRGLTLISLKIYNEEKRILMKEEKKRQQKLKQRKKQEGRKSEKALYNKLKRKFEK